MATSNHRSGGTDSLGASLNERGSLLWETMVLSGALLALASLAGMLHLSAVSLAATSAKEQALYLAEAQMARLEDLSARGLLSPGSQPYRGRPEAGEARVETLVGEADLQGIAPVIVTVHYPAGGREAELRFVREMSIGDE